MKCGELAHRHRIFGGKPYDSFVKGCEDARDGKPRGQTPPGCCAQWYHVGYSEGLKR